MSDFCLENTYNLMGSIDDDSIKNLISWFVSRSIKKNENHKNISSRRPQRPARKFV